MVTQAVHLNFGFLDRGNPGLHFARLSTDQKQPIMTQKFIFWIWVWNSTGLSILEYFSIFFFHFSTPILRRTKQLFSEINTQSDSLIIKIDKQHSFLNINLTEWKNLKKIVTRGAPLKTWLWKINSVLKICYILFYFARHSKKNCHLTFLCALFQM